jgi:hypothetical protein
MSEDWREIMLRIVPAVPFNLDPLLSKYDSRSGVDGKDFFPEVCIAAEVFRGALNDNVATIGIECTQSPAQDLAKAMKFSGLASEHEVGLVALAEEDYSGFERFGIRSEYVSGQTLDDRQACRDQIRAFWDMDAIF